MGLFLPYQWAWITDRSRIKLVEKSRQIGFSWATAYDLVRWQCRKKTALDSWVSSRDEIQARLFLQDCKKFAGILDVASSSIGEKVYKLSEDKSVTAFEMSFANQTLIHSMSSNPDAQAGKRGTRVLDEFALHQQPKILYTIALPGITWGGQMAIISTHRGKHNFFNKLVEEVRNGENKKRISLHKVSLQDALEQGFLDVLQSKLPEDDERQEMDEADYFNYVKSQCADTESFMQEYMCEPADEIPDFDCVLETEVSLDRIPEEFREQIIKETPNAEIRGNKLVQQNKPKLPTWKDMGLVDVKKWKPSGVVEKTISKTEAEAKLKKGFSIQDVQGKQLTISDQTIHWRKNITEKDAQDSFGRLIRLPLAEICVQHSKEIWELPNGMRNYILDYINKNGKRRGVAVSAHPNGDVNTYFTQDIANLNNFRKGTLIYENK